MYCKIKFLRQRGVRRNDREIAADLGAEGELTLALCGPSYELKLQARDSSRGEPIVPILYDARLTSMHGDKMLFQGIERTSDEGPHYAQAWSVMILRY
jgi:hypothetical protein